MRALLLFLILLMPLRGALAAALEIQIKDKSSDKGRFFYLLFDSEEGFPENEKKSKLQGSFSAEENSLTLNELPNGSYAFTIFHDENNNKKLDTNFLGIPKESFGFSNNPRILFGAPAFDECKFKISGDKTIKIEMKDI